MFSKKEKSLYNSGELPLEKTDKSINSLVGFLSTSLVLYALMRKGNYRAALLFYKHGGGGLNFYKKLANDKEARAFAIDYHPFWDNKTNQSIWKLHYHRGHNESQMKKHRPYQGGW